MNSRAFSFRRYHTYKKVLPFERTPSLINLLLTDFILNITASELQCIINTISRLYSAALNPTSFIFSSALSFFCHHRVFLINFLFILLFCTSLHQYFLSSFSNIEHLYTKFCIFPNTRCNLLNKWVSVNSTQCPSVAFSVKSFSL
jgi:hypothetical protein